MQEKKVFNSVLDVCGNTPLVRLNKLTRGLACNVFAKLEFLNPMGSIKDRIAKYMIEKAEEDGRLKKGQVIVENSSGNTALGMAMVAIQKGYRLKVHHGGAEILQSPGRFPPYPGCCVVFLQPTVPVYVPRGLNR